MSGLGGRRTAAVEHPPCSLPSKVSATSQLAAGAAPGVVLGGDRLSQALRSSSRGGGWLEVLSSSRKSPPSA